MYRFEIIQHYYNEKNKKVCRHVYNYCSTLQQAIEDVKEYEENMKNLGLEKYPKLFIRAIPTYTKRKEK